MDVHAKLAELRDLVSRARAMPLSASCLVNRADVLARIAEIDGALPERLFEADRVLADAEAVVAEAREQAVLVLAEAAVERDRRLGQTAEGAEASAWAAQVRADAEADAATRMAETDDYVDTRLANFEVVLERALEAARRDPEEDAGDPAADLASLTAALERALTAVRRGRDRLDGRHHMEELGDHLRTLDDPLGERSDAVDPAAEHAPVDPPVDPLGSPADDSYADRGRPPGLV